MNSEPPQPEHRSAAIRRAVIFLESKRPAIIFLVAAGFFIVSEISARVAILFVPKLESVNQINSSGFRSLVPVERGSAQAVSFFLSCSQYMQFAGVALGIWALFRLIADAIKTGKES